MIDTSDIRDFLDRYSGGANEFIDGNSVLLVRVLAILSLFWWIFCVNKALHNRTWKLKFIGRPPKDPRKKGKRIIKQILHIIHTLKQVVMEAFGSLWWFPISLLLSIGALLYPEYFAPLLLPVLGLARTKSRIKSVLHYGRILCAILFWPLMMFFDRRNTKD